MTDSRYHLGVQEDDEMRFDVHSVPIAPRNVFDHEAWPLCYRYVSLD
jgi:tyrosinase